MVSCRRWSTTWCSTATVPAGMIDVDAAMAAASPKRAGDPGGTEAGATMIYTSGTTGKPKGAFRRGVDQPVAGRGDDGLHRVHARRRLHPDRTAVPLWSRRFHGHRAGARSDSRAAAQVRRRRTGCASSRPTRSRRRSARPTPIRMVCNLPAEVKAKYDISSMKRMIANAAPWSFALKQMYLADFPADSLFEVYGSTELGVNTILRPEDQLRKPGSCGKPAPMVEIKLFDDDGNEVTGTGPEHTGELFVKSPSVFADYYKQHDKFLDDQQARLPDRRRHRLPRRRGLLLHLRPQEGHDHLRRHEHLPGRDRGGARDPPRRARGRRVRHAERGMGRVRARRRRRARGLPDDGGTR